MFQAKRSRIITAGSIALLLFTGASFGWERKLTDQEIRLVDRMMGEYEQADLFSGVVLLARQDKILFHRAYGYTDRDSRARTTPDTEFRLASVGKLFTIAAILELEDEGRLSLDDPLGKHLDGFPADVARKVTLRHLIAMTSGFGSYFEDEDFRRDPAAFRSVDDLVRIIRREKLAFEPGTRERYSNSGFALLGAVVEKVTGSSFSDHLRDSIFRPAGMTHTSSIGPGDPGDVAAVPYHRDLTGSYRRVSSALPPVSPAGNGCSTAEDLFRFSRLFCETSDLLSDRAKVVFFSDFEPNPDAAGWPALRARLAKCYVEGTPIKIFGWTGTADGISTLVRHYVGEDTTFIVLSNQSTISLEIWEQLRSILRTGAYAPVQPPLGERFYKAYLEHGIGYVESRFAEWTRDLTPERTTVEPITVLDDVGNVLSEQGKHDQAAAILELNTRLFPGKTSVWSSLGRAYAKSGNTKKAVESYEKLLTLDPQNAGALKRLKALKGER